ncbi:hypothetical protein [Brassicibacter mesophilus]
METVLKYKEKSGYKVYVYNLMGNLFQDRFKSEPINDDRYF